MNFFHETMKEFRYNDDKSKGIIFFDDHGSHVKKEVLLKYNNVLRWLKIFQSINAFFYVMHHTHLVTIQ